MRAVAGSGNPSRSKVATSKKSNSGKPKKVSPNAVVKRAKPEKKRVKKPNEKFKKKPEPAKRSPKRGEEGGPPTLCEAYTRLTTIVAETVKAGAKFQKKSKQEEKKTPVKKKGPPVKSKVVKNKKPVKMKKIDKATLDRCESLVTVLKDMEVITAYGKGIGTRRKSVCHSDDSEELATKKKKPANVNSQQSGKIGSVTKTTKKSTTTNTKPVTNKVVKKPVKDVKRTAKVVQEKKPKKVSQPKGEDKKKQKPVKGKPPAKVLTKKVKVTPKELKNKKTKKNVALSETDGSNSDEMTLNVLVKKQTKKTTKGQANVPKIKQEIKTETSDCEIKSPVLKVSINKPIKIEKNVDTPMNIKDSGTDSEDDLELQRLLAKKFPKSKPPPKKPVKNAGDTEQRARRLRLFGFWSGPKRHRVASLNASAKVHCLYENEGKAMAENDKIVTKSDEREKKKLKKDDGPKEKRAGKEIEFEQMESVVINKRTLRGAPGTRGGVGKHWEMGDSTTSSVSSDESHSDSDQRLPLQPSYRQKLQQREETQNPIIKPPPKRRRNAELGATMDLKDMVVRKRMASLNASAILAASYSIEKRVARKGSSGTSTEESISSPDDGQSEDTVTDDGKLGKNDNKKSQKKSFWKTKVENLKDGDKRNSPSPILADLGIEKKVLDKILEKERRDDIHGSPKNPTKKVYRQRVGGEKSKRRKSGEVKQINIEKIGSSDEYDYKSDSDTGQRKLIELRNAGGSNKKVAMIVNQDTDVTITGVYVNSTRSTHHEGYCSISGMQYRISSTSHTQTEATAVINTTTPDQPPTVAQESADMREPSPHVHKTYTPLSALSSMQPPPAHGHIHHHHCGLGPPQGPVSPLGRRHGCSSAFSAPPCSTPTAEGAPTPPQPSISRSSDETPPTPTRRTHGGYYQPAGPLIQHPSSKSQGQDCVSHEVTPNRAAEEPPDNPPAPPPPPISYSRSFPPYQAPYYPPGYYPQSAHYQPPQATSYHQHYHHHQDLCYPPGYPPGSYAPPTPYRRYLAPPPGYHPPDLSYSSSPQQPPSSSEPQVQQMVVAGGSSSYGPPVEHYPPPPPPPAGYCSAYPPGPGPSCYSHPPSGPSRNIPFLDSTYQSCPCPIQACPKNVHTGPLTGECKRPGAEPLPPVALALPQEPPGAAGPPSPARGSAGVAALAIPASSWPNTSPGLPPGPSGPPTGLLAISETVVASLKKRKERRDGVLPKKRVKRCNENAGIDRKPPRKADPIVLKDRNIDTMTEVIETVLKWPPEATLISQHTVAEPATLIVSPRLDTVSEVIEDVVRGRISNSTSPPILKPVRNVMKSRRVRNTSPPPPTLHPVMDATTTLIPVLGTPVTEIAALPPPTLLPVSQVSDTNLSGTKPPRLSLATIEKSKKKSPPKFKLTNAQLEELGLKENTEPVEANAELLALSVSLSTVKKCRKSSSAVGTHPICKKSRKAVSLPARLPVAPRWSNGWTWHGESYDAKVYLTNDDAPVLRRCFSAMRHNRAGDIIQLRDCILLKAGSRKTDLPFVAKVSALWENPEDGEMMVSLLWYYRPEHTDQGRQFSDQTDEIFASRHKDVNSVATIEDKCFVLTYNEYCRYRKKVRGLETGVGDSSIVPQLDCYPWAHRLPSGVVAPELVFFCRKVYDFRQKRLLKNPT